VPTTPRLFLRPWRPGDLDAFAAIAADPEVLRFINDGVPWGREQADAFAERQVRGFAERGYCRWALEARDDGAFAGFCGGEPLTQIPEVEIGWWLARGRWGQGLATEAARAALADLRDRIGLRRVVSLARDDNASSIRIMQKIGLVFDRALPYNGLPCVLYASAPQDQAARGDA
jgi:RimJ/RimL family protein N-acetyltransferase